MWTPEKVKKVLPHVEVNKNGKTVRARTGGRFNPQATVKIDGENTVLLFTWDAIATSLNTREPLAA